MADALTNELVKVLVKKMTDEAFKRVARAQGIYNELKELKKTLSRIQDLLHDASQKEATHKSVKEWLIGLQHLAYDMDDVLDDLATEDMHRELTSMVRKLIPSCCTNFSLSHRLYDKLDSIKRDLEDLEKRETVLGLLKIDEKPRNTSRRNETSLPDGSSVIGRQVEEEKLLNKLLGDDGSSKENFSIVPIVGMGGVGKTTLARLVYNNTEVKGHFEPKIWVCISDDFDVFKISGIILQSMTTESKEYKDLDQLQMALTEKFKDKRFLLVLDDVWHEDDDDWEKLVLPFRSCAHGSRIIITTRKEELLKKLRIGHLDSLKSLLHEDALSLFALHALGEKNFNSHTTLKPHGEAIVKKCAGLPLALKAIGRLLGTRTNVEDWEVVLNSEIWNLENSEKIVPALRLSYYDLSADLKQLFAYCSLFPKDFLFDKEELVLLWMAEGFLSPSNATKSPERLGHEYFQILLSRSFFQHAPNDESLFIMHDLMNDLATFVAGEFFSRDDNRVEDLSKCRHKSFIRDKYVTYKKLEAFEKANGLRTLLAVSIEVRLWDRFYFSSKILVDLLPELPLLRVLSLSHFYISEVPDFIGCLKHLRYLNLSHTKIKKLPENVGNLYNLQTLIVSGCDHLASLPKSFFKLKRLRHFDIKDTPSLKKLPFGIGELKSLQTLTKIIIERHSGFAITELKGLKDLHGEISIQGLNKVQSSMHAREANLSLKGINKLELKWDDCSESETLEKEVLNELKPRSDKLKMLVVDCYRGKEFPKWVGDPSFNRLVHVSLRGCRKCTSLPPLGQLPSLKILKFEDMSSWEVWSTNSEVMFPCLRELQITKCPKLIDVTLEALPSLRFLKIDGCCESVLRNLVRAASSTTKLEIKSILGLTDEVWRGVMENIEAVEELRIWNCDEISYLWESEEEASKVLVNLKELEVYYCKNLVRLGEKEEDEDNTRSNLLSSLTIFECYSMERLCCPHSIDSLYITLCSSLRHVSLPRATTTGGGGQNLKSLTIIGCGNLKLIDQLSNSTHLTSLYIGSCENMELFPDLHQLSNLTRLSIYGCESIESFPNLQLPNLTELSILYCKNIKVFGDLQLPNLISWMIERCENLESFPDIQLSNLTKLKDMRIRKCPMIDASFPRGLWPPNLCLLETGGFKKPISEWDYQNFPASLVHLELCDEADVKNFGQLSHLFPSSLTSLEIWNFDKLESLSTGLQHLTSLQHLRINICPKVNDLPEMLLLSLLSLRIYECPKLEERCNGRGSRYWPLISHIPCIEIDE